MVLIGHSFTEATSSSAPRAVEWSCHSIDQESGTFKQLRFAAESLHFAVENRLRWQPHPLGASLFSGCDVSFGDIADLAVLKAAFPATILDTDAPNIPIPMGCAFRVEGGEGRPCHCNPQLWTAILQSIRPSPRLLHNATQIVSGLLPPFACLHARVESDFAQHKGIRNTHRYKTAEEIREILRSHDFGDIRTLFVAGGKTGGDSSTQWDSVGFHTVRHKNYTATNMLEGAMVDMEVCKHASIHVGTAGSIWDEWLHEWRFAHGLPTLMYAAARAVDRLEPFVGANDAVHLAPPKLEGGAVSWSPQHPLQTRPLRHRWRSSGLSGASSSALGAPRAAAAAAAAAAAVNKSQQKTFAATFGKIMPKGGRGTR